MSGSAGSSNQAGAIDEPVVLDSWGRAYDMGYSAGRADALSSGVAGLLAEIERYRRALVAIGKRGAPLPAAVARQIAREALDRTGGRTARREATQGTGGQVSKGEA